jgi:Flp pilus assembly protein TadB
MKAVTSFHASMVPSNQFNLVMADYLAAEQARTFRRLFVWRFGVLAIVASIIGFLWLSPFAAWSTVGLCLVPPVSAWIVECRRERRLTRRLEAIPGATTEYLEPMRLHIG